MRTSPLKSRPFPRSRDGPSRRRKKRLPLALRRKNTYPAQEDSRYVGFNSEDNLPEWKILPLPRNPTNHVVGLRIKSSLRWCPGMKYPDSGYFIPYIDNRGRFTGYNLYNWSADPRSVISTVISTIYSRLLKYTLKTNNGQHRIIYRSHKVILMVAAYYAITKNLYILNRVLVLLKQFKRNKNTIHRIVTSATFDMDTSKRFVYSHACYQAQWLTSRAFRPRDKSRYIDSETSWLGTRHGGSDIANHSSEILTIALALGKVSIGLQKVRA